MWESQNEEITLMKLTESNILGLRNKFCEEIGALEVCLDEELNKHDSDKPKVQEMQVAILQSKELLKELNDALSSFQSASREGRPLTQSELTTFAYFGFDVPLDDETEEVEASPLNSHQAHNRTPSSSPPEREQLMLEDEYDDIESNPSPRPQVDYPIIQHVKGSLCISPEPCSSRDDTSPSPTLRLSPSSSQTSPPSLHQLNSISGPIPIPPPLPTAPVQLPPSPRRVNKEPQPQPQLQPQPQPQTRHNTRKHNNENINDIPTSIFELHPLLTTNTNPVMNNTKCNDNQFKPLSQWETLTTDVHRWDHSSMRIDLDQIVEERIRQRMESKGESILQELVESKFQQKLQQELNKRKQDIYQEVEQLVHHRLSEQGWKGNEDMETQIEQRVQQRVQQMMGNVVDKRVEELVEVRVQERVTLATSDLTKRLATLTSELDKVREQRKSAAANASESVTHLQMEMKRKQDTIQMLQLQIQQMQQTQTQFAIETNDYKEKEKKSRMLAESTKLLNQSLQDTITQLRQERDTRIQTTTEDRKTWLEFVGKVLENDSETQRSLVSQLREQLETLRKEYQQDLQKMHKTFQDVLQSHTKGRERLTNVQDRVNTILSSLTKTYSYTCEGLPIEEDLQDSLDLAVVHVLNALQCPVPIDIQKIGKGEYMLDRKCSLRLVRGEVLVRRANAVTGWEKLTKYLSELYAPFFPQEMRVIPSPVPTISTPTYANYTNILQPTSYIPPITSIDHKPVQDIKNPAINIQNPYPVEETAHLSSLLQEHHMLQQQLLREKQFSLKNKPKELNNNKQLINSKRRNSGEKVGRASPETVKNGYAKTTPPTTPTYSNLASDDWSNIQQELRTLTNLSTNIMHSEPPTSNRSTTPKSKQKSSPTNDSSPKSPSTRKMPSSPPTRDLSNHHPLSYVWDDAREGPTSRAEAMALLNLLASMGNNTTTIDHAALRQTTPVKDSSRVNKPVIGIENIDPNDKQQVEFLKRQALRRQVASMKKRPSN